MAARGRRAKLRRHKARLRGFIRRNILGLEDTPHRIAWGVFWGFVVGATPTLGFQILLYLAVAVVVRANKLAGIPPVFVSNPFTAVPIYYGTWWVGNYLLTGGRDAQGGRAAIQRMLEATATMPSPFSGGWSAEHWSAVTGLLWDLGLELWVGGLVCGAICGALAYPLAYRAVVRFRAARAARRAPRRVAPSA